MTDADQVPEHAVAVVGMAGRFPDARDVGELWQLLLDGREAVRRFGPEELRAAGLSDAAAGQPDLVPFGTVVPDVDLFDAAFFGMTPQEARLTDPQQRLFLECAYAAMQDAGVHPGEDTGPIGIFGGTALSSYLHYQVLRNDEFAGRDISFPLLIGNDKDFLCTRAAYRLGLTGPAVTVQSACSTSLTAVHVACQSLIEQECSVALAGGVSITVPQTAGYRYQEGGTLSRDGHCRPFDAAASGMVKGNGCAVVVLKRLSDAVEDRDHIYAVVRGTAVNNDGSVKAGYTAPSPQGQAAVIREATAFAGVRPADVGYVEAHGTGTYLGDPIEIRALDEAYGDDPPPECLLGSVKANVGHLDTAAGVTGLIKAALVLRHRVVPPQPNFVAVNPELKLDRTPFVVPTTVRRVPDLRVAAVSSFGIGGTNAHCVLGAAPDRPRPGAPGGDYLIALSAKDDEALGQLAADVVRHLDREPGTRLDDLAWTLLTGRARHPRRLAFAARDLAEVRRVLGGEPARPHPAGADWTVGDGPPAPELAGDLRYARTVPLPGHPLRPRRHWVEPSPARPESAAGTPPAVAGLTNGIPAPVAVPLTGAPNGTAVAAPTPALAPVSGVGSATGAGSAAAGADSEVEPEMLAIVRRHLDMPQLGADEDFFAVGGESLTAVEIVSAVRERFGVTMTLVQFEDLRTPARMAAFVRAALPSPDSTPGAASPPAPGVGTGAATDTAAAPATDTTSTAATDTATTAPSPAAAPEEQILTRISAGAPGAEDEPLFLVHPAGGTTFCYSDLARHSSDPSPLYGISFPYSELETLRTIPEIARRYAALVRRVRPHGPYRLGGYSFGGNVAFEMALQLQEAGEEVGELVLLDALPPETYEGGEMSHAEVLRSFPLLFQTAFGGGGVPAPAPPPSTLDEVVAMARQPGWTDYTAEEFKRFLRIWLSNHDALKEHRPWSRFRGDVVAFDAVQPWPPQLLTALRMREEPMATWQRHVEGRLTIVPVPGDHYSMFRPGQVAALAALFDRVLGRREEVIGVGR